jgi:hypothetical protein
MLELCPSLAMRFAERIESVIASFSVSYIWGKFFAKLLQTAGEDGRVVKVFLRRLLLISSSKLLHRRCV